MFKIIRVIFNKIGPKFISLVKTSTKLKTYGIIWRRLNQKYFFCLGSNLKCSCDVFCFCLFEWNAVVKRQVIKSVKYQQGTTNDVEKRESKVNSDNTEIRHI